MGFLYPTFYLSIGHLNDSIIGYKPISTPTEYILTKG